MKKPVLALLSIILLTAGCSQRPAATTKIPLTSAHRGAATIAPENTMASVDSCIKYGVGNIECDVCISKDSVFYVLHDSTLDRTTNGTGAISQWLSADIDTLDAGSWFAPRFAGQRVLRLTDLLRKAKEHGLRITIDYRNGSLHQLLNLIKDEGMLENTVHFHRFLSAPAAHSYRGSRSHPRTHHRLPRDPPALSSAYTGPVPGNRQIPRRSG